MNINPNDFGATDHRAVGVNVDAPGPTPATDGDSEKNRIRLHDPDRSAQLGALFAEHFASPRRPGSRVLINHVLKRLVDIIAATVSLALLWPVMLVAGLATILDTGWPIFYSQTRRVRFGRRTRIYKMRTLKVGTDRKLDALVDIKKHGRYLNIPKAVPNYTRVGRVLERLWIVELPQYWSVLLGRMSLVGNRPLPDYVVEALGSTPKVLERFASPQGLTGYIQVIGRDNLTDDERIHLELQYSDVFESGNVFIEDLRIVALTICSYLGLGRPRTADDLLINRSSRKPMSDGRPIKAAQVSRLTSQKDRQRRPGIQKTQFACPTCYIVSDECAPDRCDRECVRSCPHGAIQLGDDRPIFLDNCVACSKCVAACPMHAIDKAPLVSSDGSLHCELCRTEYPVTNGVLDLLPRNGRLNENPYSHFYESEYVNDNSEMHTEDTEWKLRELLPLLKDINGFRSLLDLGCGAGVLGHRIAETFEMPLQGCVFADLSSQVLSYARGRDPHGTYVRADAAYLPLRNRSIDLGMILDVIEHQHQPEQALQLRRRRKNLFRESSGHVIYFDAHLIRRQLENQGWRVRRWSIQKIAWSHWRNVILGQPLFRVKISALVRAAMGCILPQPVYRRLLVTNYNAFCVSERGDPAPCSGSAMSGMGKKLQQVTHQARVVFGARTYGNTYSGPLYVQIGVSNRCNYRCQFCWDHPSYVSHDDPWPDRIAERYYKKHPEIDRNRSFLPFEMFTDLVDDLHSLGTRKIKFIGRGEPFLHRRFIDMVAYAKTRGFNCSVTTNGSLIKPENVRALVAMGADEIFVSVNAASPEVYNQIHLNTRPDAFDKLTQTLLLFADEKKRLQTPFPIIRLSFVIQNNNYFQMPEMVRLAGSVGAESVAFNRVSVYSGTKFLMLNDAQNDEITRNYLVQAEQLAAEAGILTNADLFRARPDGVFRSKAIHTKIPCYIGWYFAIILADGTVNPCCECLRAMGTLKTQRFKDIWYGDEYRKFRREIIDLPKVRKEVDACRCYNCSFALHNLSMHRFLHPLSRTGVAHYGLRDLKKFMFG